jgi:16S rRNA (cytidine1402-2'-O)-methyltransferase
MLAQFNIAANLVVSTKVLQYSTIGAQIPRHLGTKKKVAKSTTETKKKVTKRKVAKDEKSTAKSNTERLPTGLYVVGTPIGNMSDITKRAMKVLKQADLVCCEDTRVTGLLLSRLGIKNHLSSMHQFTAPAKIDSIVKRIRNENAAVAIVSDAGTPLISDPGSSLVTKLQHEKIPVYAVPGPSAVTAALSVTGFPAEKFIFEGFLPKKPSKRLALLKELHSISEFRCVVFFESKFRIEETIRLCAEVWGNQHEGAIVRELTKLHEQVMRDSLQNILAEVTKNARGEYTVVIGPRSAIKSSD